MNLKNYRQVHRLTAIAFILALALVPTASAADGTWTGGTSVTWATTGNWFNGFVAGGSAANSDLATFNSGTYSFAPTAANSYFIGGLIFGNSNGAITITTGTGNNRLNVGSGGIQVNEGSSAVSIGASADVSQGASIVANQNWANNSSSLLTVNRVSVDNLSLGGTYTLTINGSGSGGVNLNSIGDVSGASDPTRLFALQINSTGGNTIISSGNSFSGGTTLTQGNLLLGNNTALGTGSLALNGGKISSSATGSQAPANNTTIGGNVTLGDAVNTGKLTFSGTIGLGTATRTLTTDSLVEFSGVVSNGGITKQGASTLTFLGASANSYTGLTTVSAGGLTLNKTAVDAIAGNVLVNGTGTLTLGAANQINNASDVEIAAGIFALGAFSDTVNNLKLTGGTVTGTTGVLTSSTAYDFQSSANVTGILAGTAGANKTTAGTVTFSGGNANTYTGLTTVSAGSLVLNRDNDVDSLAGDVLVNGTGTLSITKIDQIKNTANVEVAAGTLAISGNAETVNGVKLTGGAITGSGNASVLTSTTAFDFQSGSSTAVLAGTAGVTKTTGGTVSLGRASTYSGGTTLTAGTLQIASASTGSVGSIISSGIGTGTLNLNGGTLSSGSGTARTLLNDVTVGGNVTLGDASNSGTLSFSAGVDLGGSVRTLTTASAINFDGVVSNGGINKAGAGNLTLGGANTYTGTTSINAGTLAVTGSLLSSGTVLVNDGGSLSGSGSVGAVTLGSGSFLRPGNSPGTLTAASSIWEAGSTYSWETLTIPSLDKLEGRDWDLFSVTGALDMSDLSSSSASTKMNLVLNSLSLVGFDTSTPYTWVIAKAGSFTGYDDDNTNLTSLFDIDTANFNGGLLANLPTGGFQVVTGTDSSNLRTLNLMAIPEPSTGSMLGFGLGGLVLTRLLRRKKS
jgi:autotransporter-associated beta strand protein